MLWYELWRRRLRDLPVRRAVASLATATATAAAIGKEVAAGPTEGRDDGDGEGAPSATTKACPVCLLSQVDVAIIPCGHCICVRHFDQLTSMPALYADNRQRKSCPVCWSEIRHKLRLHVVLWKVILSYSLIIFLLTNDCIVVNFVCILYCEQSSQQTIIFLAK